MSNQIVISSGAKVRSLEGVLTGTAGIVNSVPLGGANGVATLDSNGKVPLSQLPASVVTYLGTWNAATNTPTLTNGVGDVGDLYICNVAGTVNFGAGPITFAVGDWVIYNGSQWQKSAGASGTVTSVAVTESGDALTITGSPITTAGTINIGFAGTGSQYIKGDGTLATFPTTIDQAKRLITEVYNSTGATLTKGTVVYINGGQGNLPTITKAQANSDATSAQTYGVVQSDITNMNNGFVVVFGSITDIDTQAYAVGTQLYLSGTTEGAWTSTKPSAPIHLVYVGIVVRSHPTQGVVEIRIQNGYELEELHDVAISAPVNNQGIFYNSSNDLWENKSIATALGYTPANDALVVKLAGTQTITGVKNFDVGLTLKDGIYPTPSTGYIGLASNGDGLTILTKSGATVYNHNIQFQASSNDYNFPAITGIMAMLEGSQTFTGDKTFNGDAIFTSQYVKLDGAGPSSGNTLNIKQFSSNLVRGVGYSSIGAIGNTKFTFYLGNTTAFDSRQFNLDGVNLTVNTPRTYTLPDLSGTLALLEGTQTFTGAKTFSDNAIFSASPLFDQSANFKVGASLVGTGNYIAMAFDKSGAGSGSTLSMKLADGTTAKGINLNFVGSPATYTYTFPSTSGTIALTSDIPSLTGYVPYTGATSSVNLGSYALQSSGVITESFYQFKIMSTGIGYTAGYSYLSSTTGQVAISQSVSSGNLKTFTFDFSAWSTNTSYTYTLPAANGTLALTSNLSAYLPLTGGTLTGALSGTSATFSGRLTTGGTVQITGSGSPSTGAGLEMGYGNLTAGRTTITSYNRTGAAYIGNDYNALDYIWYTSGSQKMTLTNGGNVGIGTASPNKVLEVAVGSSSAFRLSRSGAGEADFSLDGTGNIIYDTTIGAGQIFRTNGGSERMRITSGGVFKATTDGTYDSISGTANEFNQSAADWDLVLRNKNASNPYGLYIKYSAATPNGTGNEFIYCTDGSGVIRANLRSNGGLANYQANNVNLSDERTKKDIIPLESYWDKFKAIEIVKFKYKDQTHDDFNIGVIAQQVEEVAPEFIDVDGWGETPEDGVPLKSVYTADLHHATIKVLQEAMAKIEELEAKVSALENKS